ncbi:hypothetical protein BT63DRAFT_464037 [Microthyrium microscopicum]|uniref:Uncharacterized protein n=1 Tax=Microthyrium microscopicum TaxID=703497 RepID=A0A6A6U2M2_9PEZI|nr:hypothetical protein BT63DRAFT_464037 [Microthyrium microscopicum]
MPSLGTIFAYSFALNVVCAQVLAHKLRRTIVTVPRGLAMQSRLPKQGQVFVWYNDCRHIACQTPSSFSWTTLPFLDFGIGGGGDGEYGAIEWITESVYVLAQRQFIESGGLFENPGSAFSHVRAFPGFGPSPSIIEVHPDAVIQQIWVGLANVLAWPV